MYFLTQIKNQFLANMRAYDGPGASTTPSEDVPGDVIDRHIARNDVPEARTPEQLALQELNEELDAIENDSQLITSYCRILGSFLERVRDGEIEGLSSEDDDFERLLTLYKGRFDELKDLSERGHQIQHIVTAHVERLQGTIDEGIAGEEISDNIIREHAETIETNEQVALRELETQRDSLLGIMRNLITEHEGELTEGTRTFIEQNIENFDISYPEDIDTIEEKVAYLNENIIPALREIELQLQVRLRDEVLRADNEGLGDARNRAVVESYNTEVIENLTDTNREIIDGRQFQDLDVADFQRLWLEGGVDITNMFLHVENAGADSEVSGRIGESLVISFGGNPNIDELFPSLIPLEVTTIVVDGRVAERVNETEFQYEGGLPVRVRDGSNIVIQSREDLSPVETTQRRQEFADIMESNRGRQEMETQVGTYLRGQGMLQPNEREGSFVDKIKELINIIANIFGFGDVFDMYTEEELQDIVENGGMQRFVPNGAEILQDGEFMQELQEMCGRLGVQRDHMLVVMQAECGLNHTAVNPTSGASGLIQFMPATARGLGTTVEEIRGMSAIAQLSYVERYFENYSGRMHSVEDIYRVVFYPASIGKPDNWVFGSQNGTARRVSQQNPGIARHSTRADGLIDNNAFERYVQAKVSQFMTVDYSGAGAANIDGISAESLQALPENRRRVVSGAINAYNQRDILGAAHCTDWVDRVYQREVGTSVYNSHMSYNGGVNQVSATDSRDTGLRYENYAGNDVIAQIQPGDHLMVDHGPDFGRGRTHSVIALETPQNGILRVVSYPGSGRAPRVELYDLTGQGRSGARPEKVGRIHSPA